jgi:archaellum component FlaC
VPIKEKEALQKRYRAAIDKLFAVLRNGDRERGVERFRNKINGLKGQGGKLRNERERLYNKVKQLESDIATLENNIGFFSRSKGAEALIRDVENKIQRAKQEMAETIEKINLIDNQQE